jgi:hypothetical protein
MKSLSETQMFYRHAVALGGAVVAVIAFAAVAACAPKAAKPSQTISLDLSGPHPVAMLKVGAHAPVAAVFDSGAGATVVNRKLARTLGLPDNGEIDVGSPGAAAPVKGMITSLSAAKLGEAEIENGHAVAIELPPHLQEFSAIVSPNAFSGRMVRFEFPKSRAVVMDKTAAAIPPGAPYSYGGEQFHPLPAAEIDVSGKKLIAHLDSGSRNGLSLPLDMAKQLPLKGPLVQREPVRMVGGEHKAYTAIVGGQVRIGPLVLTDPEVVFVDGIPPIGNVGIQILKQLTLVLDPEEQRDWLIRE